ncbi:MAG: phosphoribosylamine--glycine ligase [Candidatus Peregrinibacteria bacterium]|nr:phosphoribosylamine--glycine ligase [Candidatus Peregrinibacteria bacterium]
MRVLLISSSARGHAIADALTRSSQTPEIISVCPQANPGIKALAAQQHVTNIMDFPSVLRIAAEVKPDFAIIGPDDPIAGGLADELLKLDIPSVAPLKSLAQVESSKGFTRNLLASHAIDASPHFRIFTREQSGGDLDALRKEIHRFIEDDLHASYVVKYDALKGGKGVKVSGDHLEAVADGVEYAIECLEECGRVVIEEKLIGVEFSLLSFVSGDRVVDMPIVQDHKRAFEGDTGPNTGGMGTYTDANHSLPFLTPNDVARAKEINRLTAHALLKECGTPYRGILYGGFIAVKDGIRLIEYNARFGDPEALNILPLLESDFVAICLAIIDGTLNESLVSFAKKATVCKYITPKSYPDAKNEKGQVVTFPKDIPENARIFYGDVSQADDGTLHLGGSRTAGIVGIADTIAKAERIAEELCAKVEGPVRHRKDIGTAKLIERRIEMLRKLRE